MVIFKCPYCGTEYEMTTAHLSFKQRSYAKCQVCNQTMYSWNSRNVPIFTTRLRATLASFNPNQKQKSGLNNIAGLPSKLKSQTNRSIAERSAVVCCAIGNPQLARCLSRAIFVVRAES